MRRLLLAFTALVSGVLLCAGSLIFANDNWVNSPQQRQIQESGIAPSDGRESAIIASLQKGNYTAVVRSSNSSSGIGVVEVYHLPQ